MHFQQTHTTRNNEGNLTGRKKMVTEMWIHAVQ